MTLPTRILVPVDFSDYSEHALDYAIALAAKLDAKVTLLNVIALPALGVAELGVLSSTMIDSMVEENYAALTKLAEARRASERIAGRLVKVGDARDTINRVAEEIGAELIIMGTHGRRGVSHALLGSVAEHVVRTAPCPVLTLRARKR